MVGSMVMVVYVLDNVEEDNKVGVDNFQEKFYVKYLFCFFYFFYKILLVFIFICYQDCFGYFFWVGDYC